MGIVSDDIRRVKENVDLVALISEHVPLKRSGRRFTGCCPFHEEKTPSFSVNPELGFYYCFGCNKKGDAITFMREYLHMEFSEAVENLAKRANITLHYDTKNEANKSYLTPIYECLQEASNYYHSLLMSNDDAKHARQYVRSRGLSKEVLEDFTIGYSTNHYDDLARQLSSTYSEQQLIDAGLCYRNSRGYLNDIFRNRLMFPIRNPSGSVIGFGARSLDGTPPKYKNTGETRLYRKSQVLYNFDKAKSAATKEGNFVVCEGYMDVIAMSRAGIEQAVATCGTSATLDHIRLMSKFVKKIILSFDADTAGKNATFRWLDFLPEIDTDLYVAQSHSAKDPADLYVQDPQLLVDMVHSAIPFLEYFLNSIVENISSTSTVEERAHIAQDVIDIIRRHPNELIREGYVMQYAPKLGFEPEWFFAELSKPERQRSIQHKEQHQHHAELPKDQNEPVDDLRQRELIRLCVHEPHSVASFIREDIFTIPSYCEIYNALTEYDNIDMVLSSLSDDTQDVLNQILVEDIAHVEEVSPYSLDVFSRVVESQMKEFLHQLVRQEADNTAQVKRLLDTMAGSIDRGDTRLLEQTALQLLELKAQVTVKKS